MSDEKIKRTETTLPDGTLHITLEAGRTVLCDACNVDWTDSPVSGGIYYGTYALCPTCAPRWEADAVRIHEEAAITHRCPPNMSFADWVRDVLRKDPATDSQIDIYKADDGTIVIVDSKKEDADGGSNGEKA